MTWEDPEQNPVLEDNFWKRLKDIAALLGILSVSAAGVVCFIKWIVLMDDFKKMHMTVRKDHQYIEQARVNQRAFRDEVLHNLKMINHHLKMDAYTPNNYDGHRDTSNEIEDELRSDQ